jgi:hypothetical protein
MDIWMDIVAPEKAKRAKIGSCLVLNDVIFTLFHSHDGRNREILARHDALTFDL